MYELKYYKSPWKAIRLILLCSPFVIFAIYDLSHHPSAKDQFMGWLCICFFGLGIPMGLFNLFDKRPELIINEDGIFARSSYGIFDKRADKGFVKWDGIEDVYLQEFSNSFRGMPTSKQKFICLKLDKIAINTLNTSRTTKKWAKTWGLGDYCIPLLHLKFDEQKFLDFIKLMSHADITKRRFLLTEFKL